MYMDVKCEKRPFPSWIAQRADGDVAASCSKLLQGSALVC